MNTEKIKGKVLVIDDHPFFGTNLKYKLKKYGYEVFTAENGTLGIIKAKQIKPDIILIDYIMPGMDGIETCEQIKKDQDIKSAHLIMYTSETYSHVVSRAIQAGAKDFITKTTPIEKIVEKLDKVTEKNES